jgi:hypothetical protein
MADLLGGLRGAQPCRIDGRRILGSIRPLLLVHQATHPDLALSPDDQWGQCDL